MELRSCAVLSSVLFVAGALAPAHGGSHRASPAVLDVAPRATIPGGQVLVTMDGPPQARASVRVGRRRVGPRDVVWEDGPDPSRSRLRVRVPERAAAGDQTLCVRTKAGLAVVPKAFSVVKCTILPEPFDIKPLGDKVSMNATLHGPGGTNRKFATPYVAHLSFGGFWLQGCAEPDDNDVCERTIVLSLSYPPASAATGAFTLHSCNYTESTDFAHGKVQDAAWASVGFGSLEITKSTPTRIGGYFTATVEAQSQAAHDIVERFTVQGSFVAVRP